ncbi:3-dehydroquinate synthase [Klebsormidium nitens]|uniref:3-dehydroquinate synthase n=1 Tax=Klebsormidium nitens TaxID=105231 RepID=A0A1Y1I8H8_KLENI|nr:3-dehydroquinate synthase [Klebsormidium nitens]|eukprot:GAQ84996.1 3-dehydroquinate synthase [Klebsormidium nitens]
MDAVCARQTFGGVVRQPFDTVMSGSRPGRALAAPTIMGGVNLERAANSSFVGLPMGAIAQGSASLSRAPKVQQPSAVATPPRPFVEAQPLPDLREASVLDSGLTGELGSGLKGLHTGKFTVQATQPIMYSVEECEDLLNPSNMALLSGIVPNTFPPQVAPYTRSAGKQLRRLLVVDENWYRLHGAKLDKYLEHHRVESKIIQLPFCEANKSFDLVFEVAQQIEDFKLHRRREPLIAIGGGVCLDVVGLAANLYRRNTPVIKIPTTLMAVVDASIGVKTAVNFHNKKNKLGTYCPPLGVFYDRAFLKTLDDRHLSNGAAEILKMAAIKDAPLFHMLEQHSAQLIASRFQTPAARLVLRRSIQGMLEELECNLYEHVLTRVVDYGHTFSPEIEMAALETNDELLHGEAVNIDMALTTEIAHRRGYITADHKRRVFAIMRALRLPFWHASVTPKLLIKGLRDMTIARDGLQRVPLMSGIGGARFVNNLSDDEVFAAAAALQHYAQSLECPEAIDGLSPFFDMDHFPSPAMLAN